ncbi:hypothetical protein SAMN05444404_2724 [Ruegeria lacuscaerulensis ITI-1157]|nr:hypothetical protein SAMN05444404_2724 [Ruegeria lacuscaerulensis ITI-1157]
MSFTLSKIAIVLTLLACSVSATHAEGQFLEGCLALKGNEQQFRKTTVTWLAQQKGETIIAYASINVGGKAAVCGLYVNEGVVPQTDLKFMLSKSEIKVGRQTLLRNLSFFKNACNGGGCKLCAPCFMTTLNWKPAYARAKLSLHETESFEIK